MTNPIDTMTRTFVAAAVELGEAMLAQLAQTDTNLHAKVAQAVTQGERLMVGLELDGAACAVRLITVDDYQRIKRIMTIAATEAPKH